MVQASGKYPLPSNKEEIPMILIAAADKNWGIGKDQDLLVKLSKDMKFFRTKTSGHVVIMGRKTLESLPKQQPLPNRTNIILTKNPSFQCEKGIVCHSVEETLETIKNYKNQEIYIIGGETIYKTFLPYCDTAYITKLHTTFDADTFLSNLDSSKDWNQVEESPIEEENGVSFSYVTYKRV